MPYIKGENRDVIRGGGAVSDAGQLNFAFTELALNYIALNGRNYQSINDIIGALEACKLEFYRRLAVPFEEKKMAENGDIAGYFW